MADTGDFRNVGRQYFNLYGTAGTVCEMAKKEMENETQKNEMAKMKWQKMIKFTLQNILFMTSLP